MSKDIEFRFSQIEVPSENRIFCWKNILVFCNRNLSFIWSYVASYDPWAYPESHFARILSRNANIREHTASVGNETECRITTRIKRMLNANVKHTHLQRHQRHLPKLLNSLFTEIKSAIVAYARICCAIWCLKRRSPSHYTQYAYGVATVN